MRAWQLSTVQSTSGDGSVVSNLEKLHGMIVYLVKQHDDGKYK